MKFVPSFAQAGVIIMWFQSYGVVDLICIFLVLGCSKVLLLKEYGGLDVLMRHVGRAPEETPAAIFVVVTRLLSPHSASECEPLNRDP